MTDEHREDANSTPGQMSGEGSVSVNAKRPVVKMTAINFIEAVGVLGPIISGYILDIQGRPGSIFHCNSFAYISEYY